MQPSLKSGPLDYRQGRFWNKSYTFLVIIPLILTHLAESPGILFKTSNSYLKCLYVCQLSSSDGVGSSPGIYFWTFIWWTLNMLDVYQNSSNLWRQNYLFVCESALLMSIIQYMSSFWNIYVSTNLRALTRMVFIIQLFLKAVVPFGQDPLFDHTIICDAKHNLCSFHRHRKMNNWALSYCHIYYRISEEEIEDICRKQCHLS